MKLFIIQNKAHNNRRTCLGGQLFCATGSRTMVLPVLECLTVRNPRNTEWLRVARKAYGYEGWLNRTNNAYYYRIELDKKKNCISASVRHRTDGIVLQVSTSDKLIRNRLHNPTDVSSAENLGRLLALRCLKAGIHFACVHIPDLETSEKSRAFRNALESSGLVLNEFETIEPNYHVDKRYHWIYEQLDREKPLEIDDK
ncbi:39S ribosomal protein L18, mitochondrial [Trichinella patagoniensis]|uniref:39S ribosomal protein L18, mitochondrial n=1 Tax=Trichinella patagoniensis TaxID=990121 RepID=A0A0V0ZF26_9BILA|nr:39S ribosomal protein L18, mitochondrial [Trichinella patagoniensis]